MSAAEERLAELLDRWITSVELHERYLELDDDAYARMQDWPRHQRPSKWLIDLARARLAELNRALAERSERGDTGFAEGLELMAFLTTLLGAEHVERFIPIAHPPTNRSAGQIEAPTAPAGRDPVAARGRSPTPGDDTVLSPELEKVSATVIADAVRLLNWGREWPQLAGLISRLADRPGEQDVWKILRRHRDSIESQARRPVD